MLKSTPPLGWNTWNTFGKNINEQLILEAADKIVASGLKDCGYEYVVIDDCWSLKERDANGKLVADPEKFPHGMKYLADAIHAKGLKFGMYSCAGTLTCAGYPASYDREFIDAATFAEWGVDFLKYDYCYHTPIIETMYLYRRMGAALANCGREILFSACSWGTHKTHEWIKTTGASMWRSTGDIFDSWESIKNLTLQQEAIHPYNGVGCFNDMDMLVVGMGGQGNVGRESGCTFEEYRTHFSIWCMMGSPLMIGCDVRNMSEETKTILMNKEAIAIDQDPSCNQPYRIGFHGREGLLIYARLLSDGDFAIGAFNMSDSDRNVDIAFDEIGLPISSGKDLLFHNVWTGEDEKTRNNTYSTRVAPHDCRLWRCKVI